VDRDETRLGTRKNASCWRVHHARGTPRLVKVPTLDSTCHVAAAYREKFLSVRLHSIRLRLRTISFLDRLKIANCKAITGIKYAAEYITEILLV
jgi:hypothetical protein